MVQRLSSLGGCGWFLEITILFCKVVSRGIFFFCKGRGEYIAVAVATGLGVGINIYIYIWEYIYEYYSRRDLFIYFKFYVVSTSTVSYDSLPGVIM